MTPPLILARSLVLSRCDGAGRPSAVREGQQKIPKLCKRCIEIQGISWYLVFKKTHLTYATDDRAGDRLKGMAMKGNPVRSDGPRALCALLLCGLTLSPLAMAGTPTLNGDPVTVSFLETTYPPVTDTVTANPGGAQIVGNPMPTDPQTNIGEQILQTGENVTLQNLQIVFNLNGNGGSYTGSDPGCAGSPGCYLWGGTADDSRFQFSNLSFGTPNTILQNVSVTPQNVFGVQLLDVTATSFVIEFGSAGILRLTNGDPGTGTITMDLQTEVLAVPEPATWVSLLGGVMFLVWRRSRAA